MASLPAPASKPPLPYPVSAPSAMLIVDHFTDPACPFAFSAEPVRQCLRWHYREQLLWRTRLIVLTREPGEARNLAEGAFNLQRAHGMPLDPRPRARPASSEPASRWLVGVRRRAPGLEDLLLRRLRVRTMSGGLLDDPRLLAAAAADVGLDPRQVKGWSEEIETAQVLEDDAAAARRPSPAARALDHKLAGPVGERRYTAPSYEFRRADNGLAMSVPGFNTRETYEAAIANLAPELTRHPAPQTVTEVLGWADYPLATAEIAALLRADVPVVRADLATTASPEAAGADMYWHADSGPPQHRNPVGTTV